MKENFDRFISCKNTIDDIHTRLRKAEKTETTEKDDDGSGASTADMVDSVAEVRPHGRRCILQWAGRQLGWCYIHRPDSQC